MKEALKEAKKAYQKNDVPVGCVAVKNGKIIARAHNLRESTNDPTAHAEILCLKKAAKKQKWWVLKDVDIYVTLEPCPMCTAAIMQARARTIIYGADNLLWGACSKKIKLVDKKIFQHKIKIVKNVLPKESSTLLKKFFKKVRKK